MKIIREKYEAGVLVAREIEVDGRDAIAIAKLCVQVVIAIGVAVIAAVNVHDSLTFPDMAAPAEMVDTTCGPPTFRS